MKVNEVNFYQTKYFSRFLKKDIHEQFVLDSEIHQQTIRFFNALIMENSLFGEMRFLEKPILQAIILDVFPEEFSIHPDFSTEIYTSLLIYYEFLYKEKVFSKEDYMEIVLFFQQNLFTFLKKMAKTSIEDGSFNDFNQEILSELSDLMEELEPSPLNQLPLQSGHSNVIQMPTRMREVELTKKEKVASGYVQLRVDLKGFKPPIWRRVIVPIGLSYATLHEIIQALFEWQNNHLHLFEIRGRYFGNLEDEDITPSEHAYLLTDLEANIKSFNYIYDLGNDWEHSVKIEKIMDPSEVDLKQGIECLKAVQDAPIDDEFAEDDVRGHSSLAEINARLAQIKF